MGSIITFIIIIMLIKRGFSSGRGFRGVSDVGRIVATVCGIVLLISLLSSWVFWLLLAILFGVAGVFIAKKIEADQRAKKYGWNTAEYNRKYEESLKKFREMYADEARQKSNWTQTQTEKLKIRLDNEKLAAEKARDEADAYMFSKYGDPVENERLAKEARKKSAQAKPIDHGSAAGYSSNPKEQKKKAANLKSRILPKAPAKRRKIVSDFSEKYNLYLTEEQIQRIVDASYMSVAWKNELESMAGKYDSVYSWMVGDTACLRAYLRAFTVQDVTSDYKQQMQIVMDSFEQIFEYSDAHSTLSIDQRISYINREFMTNFDEITYMIAYRFLESLGLHHQLDRTTLNRMDDSIEDLVEKYDNMSMEAVDAELGGKATGTQN